MVDTRSSLSQRLLRDWVLSSVRPRNEASAMLLVCSLCYFQFSFFSEDNVIYTLQQ